MKTNELIEYLDSIESKNRLKLTEIKDKLLELDEIKEELRDFDLEIKALVDVIKPEKLIKA